MFFLDRSGVRVYFLAVGCFELELLQRLVGILHRDFVVIYQSFSKKSREGGIYQEMYRGYDRYTNSNHNRAQYLVVHLPLQCFINSDISAKQPDTATLRLPPKGDSKRAHIFFIQVILFHKQSHFILQTAESTHGRISRSRYIFVHGMSEQQETRIQEGMIYHVH